MSSDPGVVNKRFRLTDDSQNWHRLDDIQPYLGSFHIRSEVQLDVAFERIQRHDDRSERLTDISLGR